MPNNDITIDLPTDNYNIHIDLLQHKMSITQSSSTTTTVTADQAKLEKAQRKADRAVRRLAKTEKSQLKASSSTPAPTPTATSTATTSAPTTTMPTTPTPSKKEKKRKASSSVDDPTSIPTTSSATTNPTDPTSTSTDHIPDATSVSGTVTDPTTDNVDAPKAKRQKSKKSKSAAKQLQAPSTTTLTSSDAGMAVEGDTGMPITDVQAGADPNVGTEVQASAEQPDEEVQEEDEPVLTNPAEDTKLDDQAKKALIYAHTYTQNKQDPTVIWKFNKAKQNWLVRNIWSVELIPGRWVGLVIGYLKTMQGIAQKNLVAEAKKHLATPIIAPLPTDDAPATTKPAESPAAPSSDAAAETGDDGENKSEDEIVVEDSRTKEVKDRARRILTAVGIDCWSV